MLSILQNFKYEKIIVVVWGDILDQRSQYPNICIPTILCELGLEEKKKG
jgi:hypothetical protein